MIALPGSGRSPSSLPAPAASGKAAEALSVYEELRKRLGNDLGIAPSAPLRELHERLLRAG